MTDFERDVLDAWMEGHRSAQAIVRVLGLDPARREEVSGILASTAFQSELVYAEAHQDRYAETRLKRKLPRFLRRQEELAAQDTNLMVAAKCNTDLLDRAGTSPTRKVEFTTPESYKEAVQDLVE